MRVTSILACLALALGLAACGDDDDDKKKGVTGGEADAVAAVARTIVIDKNKACDVLTQNSLEEYTATGGVKAKAACERKSKNDVFPKSAEITVLAVSGNDASVGYTTSQDLTGAMKLKKVDGEWRVDQIASIP